MSTSKTDATSTEALPPFRPGLWRAWLATAVLIALVSLISSFQIITEPNTVMRNMAGCRITFSRPGIYLSDPLASCPKQHLIFDL